jgi:hypothetical protein
LKHLVLVEHSIRLFRILLNQTSRSTPKLPNLFILQTLIQSIPHHSLCRAFKFSSKLKKIWGFRILHSSLLKFCEEKQKWVKNSNKNNNRGIAPFYHISYKIFTQSWNEKCVFKKCFFFLFLPVIFFDINTQTFAVSSLVFTQKLSCKANKFLIQFKIYKKLSKY